LTLAKHAHDEVIDRFQGSGVAEFAAADIQ
jgi:hypothetical protein